jgi:hypothetical protein
MTLTVEFCGETFPVDPSRPFFVGREGDLAVDDNPFLHRRFLVVRCVEGMWLLENVGAQLSATVSDAEGRVEAFLAPGAVLPIVFSHSMVSFTAGPTAYSFSVMHAASSYSSIEVSWATDNGETTIGVKSLTPDQKRLIVVLAEPRLRGDGAGSVAVPSSQTAAERLGWTITRFNRKLDNVCGKLERLGVRGLHGGPDKLAANRRARLVEYAVATRLVTKDDLWLLDGEQPG